jgi:hypothetical protein
MCAPRPGVSSQFLISCRCDQSVPLRRIVFLGQWHLRPLQLLLMGGCMAIPHDGQQPGLRIGCPQGVESPIGTQDGVLHDIVRTLRRLRRPPGKPVRGIQMRQDLRLKATAPVIQFCLKVERRQPVPQQLHRQRLRLPVRAGTLMLCVLKSFSLLISSKSTFGFKPL